ncbi:MAG: YggS family pyridoxal phosphate-dependent enzyme [Helicobacteraceae bacterium]|jgi:pyridoxal phosphate enzyme (YggS family)|nr:YggS family pyridoxal phosphate-dependent enzyme [Helicobacteraceae bacterium]
MSALQEALERVDRAKRARARTEDIKIVAASKYANADQIAKLYSQEQLAFGENKTQDFELKLTALKTLAIEWHFIGALQTNKINKLIALRPALIHSIDSLKTAQAFNDRLLRANQTQRALLQINAAKEPTKSGVLPEKAIDIYNEIVSTCLALKLEGVMTIGAHTDDQKTIQNSFEITRKIYDQISNAKTISMGMSGDFELAIACGANMLRLGSILFKR